MVLQRRDDSRLWLCLGFLSVSAAVVIAYQDPATGYELSIYSETPLAYWLCLSAGLLLSVVVVFSRFDGPTQSLGVVLGSLSMTTIVATPIIRGYHYYGTSDSLSHLGTAKDMNLGVLNPLNNRYPIVHTLGSMLADVTGVGVPQALLVVVVVFILCFFVFIPIAIRALTNDSRLAYIGLFSSFLLLPLNHISPSTYIHPTSQAIMYAPALVFLFILVYKERVIRYSMLFLLLSTMYVILHLQQAANFVVFFGTIAGLQIGRLVVRRKRPTTGSKPVYPLVSVFTLLFWVWVQRIETFWGSLAATITILFTETAVAASTASRSVSLGQVGGSLPEVFVKLFSVQLVYSLFAAILMFSVVLRLSRVSVLGTLQAVMTANTDSERALLGYFIGGFIAVFGIFFIYLVGGISDQYFRHLGTIMILVTILGTISIGRAMQYVGRHTSGRTARLGTTALLVVFLLASFPVVFTSPYFYTPSEQVTEKQLHGYETTFENQASSVLFSEVRSSTSRYGAAVQGKAIPREAYYVGNDDENQAPDHFANQSLRTQYDQRTYLPVTEADRIRDPILWEGFRFNHSDFRYLDAEPGINKVQSNGGYDLYLVRPAANSTDSGSNTGTS